jgi:hypothetical protein
MAILGAGWTAGASGQRILTDEVAIPVAQRKCGEVQRVDSGWMSAERDDRLTEWYDLTIIVERVSEESVGFGGRSRPS